MLLSDGSAPTPYVIILENFRWVSTPGTRPRQRTLPATADLQYIVAAGPEYSISKDHQLILVTLCKDDT
jgi:hypothetical protein